MTDTPDLVTLYVTFPNHHDATRICTHLISANLVACANIIEGGQSLYKWKGQVQFENEVVAFLKTRRNQIDAAIAEIKKLHSYEVPCITVSEIIGGNKDYLDWVASHVKA